MRTLDEDVTTWANIGTLGNTYDGTLVYSGSSFESIASYMSWQEKGLFIQRDIIMPWIHQEITVVLS